MANTNSIGIEIEQEQKDLPSYEELLIIYGRYQAAVTYVSNHYDIKQDICKAILGIAE